MSFKRLENEAFILFVPATRKTMSLKTENHNVCTQVRSTCQLVHSGEEEDSMNTPLTSQNFRFLKLKSRFVTDCLSYESTNRKKGQWITLRAIFWSERFLKRELVAEQILIHGKLGIFWRRFFKKTRAQNLHSIEVIQKNDYCILTHCFHVTIQQNNCPFEFTHSESSFRIQYLSGFFKHFLSSSILSVPEKKKL